MEDLVLRDSVSSYHLWSDRACDKKEIQRKKIIGTNRLHIFSILLKYGKGLFQL